VYAIARHRMSDRPAIVLMKPFERAIVPSDSQYCNLWLVAQIVTCVTSIKAAKIGEVVRRLVSETLQQY